MVQIQLFCQQYTKKSTSEMKKKFRFLEEHILNMCSSISEEEETRAAEILEMNRILLKNLYEERDQGAVV